MTTQNSVLEVKTSMEEVMQRASDAGGTDRQIGDAAMNYAMRLASSNQVEHAHIAAAFLDSIGLSRDAGRIRDLVDSGKASSARSMSRLNANEAKELLSAVDSNDVLRHIDNMVFVSKKDDYVALIVNNEIKLRINLGERGEVVDVARDQRRYFNADMHLPDPALTGSSKIQGSVRGMKTSVNDSVQEGIAISILNLSNAPLNASNIFVMMGVIKETKWIRQQPRGMTKQLQGDDYVLEMEDAIRSSIDPKYMKYLVGMMAKYRGEPITAC